MNVYNDILIDKKFKQNWKIVWMDGSDSIVFMLYIKIYHLLLYYW